MGGGDGRGPLQARCLVAVIDANGSCLDGQVSDIMGIEPLADKWRAFGWQVDEVDGHDVVALCAWADDLPPADSSVRRRY